jgi:hypothetical protein
MRTGTVALLSLAPLLSGCLVLRAGGGATFERARDDDGHRHGPGRFDAEAGLAISLDRPEDAWILSALAVHREPRAGTVGWTLAALEVARSPGPSPDGSIGWGPPGGRSRPPGLRDYGLRLELGRSLRGNYLGTALKATWRLAGAWTLTGLLSLGANTGPDVGESAGLHLLVGFN